jgi:hypothetical protein
MQTMNHLTGWIASLLLAIALLSPHVSVAQRPPPLEPQGIEARSCVACVSPVGTEALSGFSYRGRLDSDTGTLAVLTRDGREQVVSVGATLAGDWKVIAIDAQAVSFQQVGAGVYQRLWFGGGKAQMPPDGPPQRAARPRLRWDAPSAVQAGSEFSVVLLLPGLEVQSGEITLEYDTKVLLMTDATGKWEDHNGRTELQVAEAGNGDHLAEVAFRVVAQDASITRLRVRSMTLVDGAGIPISAPAESDLQIEVAVATAPVSAPKQH